MTDEKDTPQFSENKVDDLIAAHGREASKKDLSMVEAMIEVERTKQKNRKKMREQKEAQKLKRGKGRKM